MKIEEKKFKERIRGLLSKQIRIIEFEKMLYDNIGLEEIIGEKMYFELVSINFKDKNALKEIEKIIEPYYNYGHIETERIIALLTRIVNEDNTLVESMGKLYDDYCYGYHFLRILGLSYISLAKYDETSVYSDYDTLMKHIDEFKCEANRILGFFKNREIQIVNKYEYVDTRKDEDKIEERYWSGT